MSLRDRLSYALIGFVLGAIIGAVLWLLYDYGASLRMDAPSIHFGLKSWASYGGAAFAAIGFVFGAGVGGAAGATSREVYRHESEDDFSYRMPRWLIVVAIVIAAAVAWHLTHGSGVPT